LWSTKIRFRSSQQVSHAARGELWHDQGVIAFAQIVKIRNALELITDD
jgi:hypothetical protein